MFDEDELTVGNCAAATQTGGVRTVGIAFRCKVGATRGPTRFLYIAGSRGLWPWVDRPPGRLPGDRDVACRRLPRSPRPYVRRDRVWPEVPRLLSLAAEHSALELPP